MYIYFQILIGLVALKSILGYRFPWEKCGCCGKKIKDHKNEY